MTLINDRYERTKNIPTFIHSEQGIRYSNEDTHVDGNFTVGKTNFRVLAIFDGHGGPECSEVLQSELLNFLRSGIQSTITLGQDLVSVCNNLNEFFIKNDKTGVDPGSCALFCLIWYQEDKGKYILTIVNVGDSRGILISTHKFYQLNVEHKPNNIGEKSYIESQGGFVENGRLNGSLAVSRAFGDSDLISSGLRCEPDVTHHELNDNDIFLVLACDGVWDVMTNDDVANFIRKYYGNQKKERVAEALVEQALLRNTTDNVTVIVSDLRALFT